ncbi:hypothetical protein ACFS7Z_02180 [Pontibacter toksunensis]|uniref:Glycosyl transferase n=1 Tax=Pontibacter toksunensis TaxID=1332631 RepID=A0ABW6BQF6_9BACT
MKSAFTICSNNYLARAKVVADSFVEHHPEASFFIFLVDKFDPSLDYELFNKYTLIPIHEVLHHVEELALKYNIIELSTAVKPAAFSYLLQMYGFETIAYLDPDLRIYSKFQEVENALQTHNIVLTPHFCSPVDDGKQPSDVDFIPFGIYNLGFIALKNSEETRSFLAWWHERLMKYCFIRPHDGMFTDQLWINYAPIFFEHCYVLKHLGYNMANWNLYERELSESEGGYLVNSVFDLRFYHFSHYKSNNPYSISDSQNRFTLEERQDLQKLYVDYHKALIQNKHEQFSQVVSYYKLMYDGHKAAIKANEPPYSFKKKFKLKLKNMLTDD